MPSHDEARQDLMNWDLETSSEPRFIHHEVQAEQMAAQRALTVGGWQRSTGWNCLRARIVAARNG